jgi:hypothetical protein
MLGVEAIPWYPWTKLFLAQRRGDWTELYQRVGEALGEFAAAR